MAFLLSFASSRTITAAVRPRSAIIFIIFLRDVAVGVGLGGSWSRQQRQINGPQRLLLLGGTVLHGCSAIDQAEVNAVVHLLFRRRSPQDLIHLSHVMTTHLRIGSPTFIEVTQANYWPLTFLVIFNKILLQNIHQNLIVICGHRWLGLLTLLILFVSNYGVGPLFYALSL